MRNLLSKNPNYIRCIKVHLSLSLSLYSPSCPFDRGGFFLSTLTPAPISLLPLHTQPNDEKQPYNLDLSLLRHQVLYLGLMENIRVRRAGFAYRQSYSTALMRYAVRDQPLKPASVIVDYIIGCLATGTRCCVQRHGPTGRADLKTV